MGTWTVRLRPDVSEFWPPLNGISGPTRLVLRAVLAPISVIAMAGYVGCCIIFPAALMYLPLQFMDHRPGAGWVMWAALVVVVYGAILLSMLSKVVARARSRVIDVPGFLHSMLFVAGFLLAAWFIPSVIEKPPPSDSTDLRIAVVEV